MIKFLLLLSLFVIASCGVTNDSSLPGEDNSDNIGSVQSITEPTMLSETTDTNF